MSNDTQSDDAEAATPDEPRTSGHVERTILHHVVGDGPPYEPTTVGDTLEPIAAVIDRGGYANHGPRGGATGGLVQQSTVRRTFTQLHDKGLVRRAEELDPTELRSDRYDLGELEPGGDPDDPSAYAKTSDDARKTDWLLTPEGRREVDRLDDRYAAELDELAARYGRPRGETTRRIEA